MSVYVFYAFGIAILALITIFLYRFSSNQAKKIVKYFPAFVISGAIGIVILKMAFFSQRFETIIDIVLLILLSIMLAISLLIAIMMDFLQRKK